MFRISRMHGVTVDELRRLNNLSGDRIHVGQVLTVGSERLPQQVAMAPRPPAPTGPKAGEVWKEPYTGMEFVWVPQGCFMMGSPSSEAGRNAERESPYHEICVDGFWMGRYEVTNRQFRLFRSGHNSGDYKGHTLNRDDQPVVRVNWNDARAYAQWLSNKTGQTFRLPTEAEWEYAARGSTTTARYWGENPDDACRYANVNDLTSKRVNNFSWANHNCDDGYAVTAPVGSFTPNSFGLYDMLGNVWEWCEDVFEGKAYSQSIRSNNPVVTGGGSSRVLRGGSWNSEPSPSFLVMATRKS